jgi:N-carbamoyl-L-amino-acid hydrolase
VVIWNNEEGARFAPTTMGSAVHAGALSLSEALNSRDQEGLLLGDELARSLTGLGSLAQIPLASASFGYIEAHIEQGPILESADIPIGVVTGIQGIIQFNVTVIGEEAHAGTTPRSRRKDALVAALSLIDEIRTLTNDIEDEIRFTVGRLTVAPGAPNTVPSKVGFTIDLRHPDDDKLQSLHARISELCGTFVSPCEISAVTTLNSPPIAFNRSVMAAIEKHADQLGIRHMKIASGATHDAKFMAALCPTGMIFIPCRDGISHNEREWAEFEHMACGADLLLRVVKELCMTQDKDASPTMAR